MSKGKKMGKDKINKYAVKLGRATIKKEEKENLRKKSCNKNEEARNTKKKYKKIINIEYSDQLYL